ncbi:hypothetical protein D9M71_693960 [compost metagenome]
MQGKGAIGGRGIHAHHVGTTGAEHVAVLRQQRGFDENHFRRDERHLPAVFLQGVADVGMGNRHFALERGPGVQQRQVVVFQNAQCGIAALQLEPGAQQIGDLVGQAVQFIETIPPVALDVDQRFLSGIALGNLGHDAGKVHLHRDLRLLL